MSKAYYSEFHPLPSASGVVGTTLPATRNHPRGDWTSLPNGTQLDVGDIITYFGSAFTVVATHNKSASATPDMTPAHYDIFVESGTDGTPYYTWFAYADNATGTLNFTNGAAESRTYIGVAHNRTTPTESTNPADYVWQKVTGSDAKTVVLVSNRQGIYYDSAGAPIPTAQTTLFTANRQNTTNSVTWSITDINGIAQSSAYLTAQTATTCQLTEANFALARNGTTGVIVRASITDGTTFFDTINVLRVAQGVNGNPGLPGSPGLPGNPGPAGPVLDISTHTGQFIMVDGVLNPSMQSLTVSAKVNNEPTPIYWVVQTPSGDPIRILDGAVSIVVTEADLGANESIQVRGYYSNFTVTAGIILPRKYILSSDYLATIAYNADNARDVNNMLLNISADSTISKKDKTQYVIPMWATVQSNYVKYRAEGVSRGVSVAAFDSAYNALNVYIASYSSMLNPNKATSATNDFNNYVANYYKEEAALVAAANNAASQTSTWTGVTGSSKPADNAGTTLSLALIGPPGAVLAGNSVTLISSPTGSYNQGAISLNSFPGSAYAEATLSGTHGSFGLTTAATANSIFEFGCWALYFGTIHAVHPNGTTLLYSEAMNASTVYAIFCDGVNIKWTKNGIPIYTIAAPSATANLLFKAAFNTTGSKSTGIRFEPFNNASWSGIYGTGKPQDNATMGTPTGYTVAYGAFFGDDGSSVLAERNRTSRLTQAGRGNDGRFLNSNNNFGLRSLNDAPVFTDTDNGSSVTINIPAMTYYPDWGGSITFPAGSVPSAAYNTRYYIYRNQADPATTGESWGVTTDLLNSLGTGKVYVGTLLTRAAAGAPSPPPPLPPDPGDRDYCVVCEAFVPTLDTIKRAFDITKDDTLIILDEKSMNSVTNIDVESNEIGLNICVKLTTQTGIKLTVSQNTPITLRDGGMVLAANCLNYDVPVLDNGMFRWERVEAVENVGIRPVSRIRCYQSVYAAGNEKERYILTHNPIYYDKP